MSAHAFWATSACQSLSLVGESVSHQMSTPPKRSATAPILRQNGLTNRSTTTNVVASSAAAIRLPAPNGASNHTAPNAQAAAMVTARRTSSTQAQRTTRIRFPITSVPNDRGEEQGFRTGSMGLGVELENAMDLGDGLRVEG